ncbi:smallish isoform X4 [Musca autumnalis]|uniref:smallish isoform X4 n=1 Tax=Musca autumnalis TaxID=221902 RepID=UPI003CF34BB3
MPLECERSSTSPSSSATTTAALTSAALIASEIQHNQTSSSSASPSSTNLNEELTHHQQTATTSTSIMDGEMSTSQTSTTSNSSSCNGGSGRKTSITSPDPTAYVAKARVTRPTPPPPPYNPMQFVQIKPCNLYQTAQEQLKKAEEVKKIKEIRKEEPEDWQNNLDNWKSSRRKRVEHIIDRVVEVKKLELEEHDRTRRKSKTFSEMIENRSDRVGRPALKKLASLAVYTEDESNDLSDLGIGTSSASGKSSLSEDYDNNSVMSDNAAELDKAISNCNNHNNKTNNHQPHQPTDSTTREYISSPGYETSSSTAPASTPDPCEYTYEGAIQDYKQRVSRAVAATTTVGTKLLATTTTTTGVTNNQNSKESTPERSTSNAYPPRRGSKIEDRLIGFEVQSPSEECIVGEKAKVDLPKIDISKRKEIFESQASVENKSGNSSTASVPRVTLRDRFKPVVESTVDSFDASAAAKKEVRRLSGDITSIKERLQSLEQQKQHNLVNGGANSAGASSKQLTSVNKLVDVPVPPLKERLSSLQNAVATKEEIRKPPVALVDARQLEIMKSEEEKVKQQQQQQQHQQQTKVSKVIAEVKEEVQQEEKVKEEEVKPINQINETITTTTTTTTIIKNDFLASSSNNSEVDRDDSGIHTADDIDVADDHIKKEQELKLNAAIEALAMEEKQFAEAANAVNQIEAEFEELSLGGSVTLPPLAKEANNTTISNSSTTSTSITNDHMEYSINEALESALAAIDKESNLHQQHHQTNGEYFPQPQTVPSSNNANNNNNTINTSINATSHNSMLEVAANPEEIITLTNKTDEEKQFLSEGETTTKIQEALEIQEKSEEEISKEPIYENVNVQTSEQQLQQQQTIIPSMNNKQQPQQSELNQNEEFSNQNCSQIKQSQTTTTTAPILVANNTNNNNNNSNNNNVDELTNAFANATLLTTNNTTTNLPTVAAATVDSEQLTDNTSNNNPNTTPSMFSETFETIIEQTKPNDDEPIEPYYQVPKSSEPYYDAPKHLKPIPVYENIEIFFNGNGLGGEESSMHLEPPKEKPPPPPIESPPLFDDVDSSHTTDTYSSSENTYETLTRHQLNHHLQYQQQQQQQQPQDHPSPPMKRMNSTKRIKKELRNKRSSFLGIEGSSMDDDDSYLELTVAPPPDMAQLLQEERRLEKQMYLKAGLCDSSDTGESRDSGVSENHSRQSSEHYTNSSEENEPHDDSTSPLTLQTPITLDPPTNDMIYQNDGLLTVAPTPLLQTVKGNSAESWTESATVAAAATQSLTEATATANAKMLSIEEKIREQEEVLRVERELLQLEQEELKRQRENLMLRENMARRELQHGAKMLMSANRRSLQDLNGLGAMTVPSGGGNVNIDHNMLPPTNGVYQMNGYQQQHYPANSNQSHQQQIYANIPNLQQQYYQMDTDYRKSMSDINEFSKRMMQPPVPPSKPMRAMHVNTNVSNTVNGMPQHNGGGIPLDSSDFSSRQRHSLNSQHFGGSLVKIAPTAAPRSGAPHIYSNYQHHQSEQNLNTVVNGQNAINATATVNQSLYPGNMSRNTLHALSATPKPKYTDGWVQVQQRKSYDSNLTNDPAWISAYQQKRKSMPDAYHGHSNNHWLVQEAEQRRLVEQQQQQRRVQSSSNTPTHTTTVKQLTNGGGVSSSSNGKPLPDSIIQTLTERVQSKGIGERKRNNLDKSPLHAASQYHQYNNNTNNKGNPIQQQSSNTSSSPHHNNLVTTTTHRHTTMTSSSSNGQLNQMTNSTNQDKVLSVSGKKKCSHCGDELGNYNNFYCIYVGYLGCTDEKCRHTHRELKYIVWV